MYNRDPRMLRGTQEQDMCPGVLGIRNRVVRSRSYFVSLFCFLYLNVLFTAPLVCSSIRETETDKNHHVQCPIPEEEGFCPRLVFNGMSLHESHGPTLV